MHSFPALSFIWILIHMLDQANICPFRAFCDYSHELNPDDFQLRTKFPHSVILYIGESQIIPLVFEKKTLKGFEAYYNIVLTCTPVELINCDFNGLYQKRDFVRQSETRINISLNFIKKKSYEIITKSWSFLASVQVKPKLGENYRQKNYQLLEKIRKTVFNLFKKENYCGIVIILYVICVLFPIITLVVIVILNRKSCFRICMKLNCKERRSLENNKDDLSFYTFSPSFGGDLQVSTLNEDKFDSNLEHTNSDTNSKPYFYSPVVCEVSAEKLFEDNTKCFKNKETSYGDYNLPNNLPDILKSHDLTVEFNGSVYNNSVPAITIENNQTRSSIESGEIHFYSKDDDNKKLHFLHNSLSYNKKKISPNISSKDTSEDRNEVDSHPDTVLMKKELNLLARRINIMKRKVRITESSQNDCESQNALSAEIHKKYNNPEKFTIKKNHKRNILHQKDRDISSLEKSNKKDQINIGNFKFPKNFNVHNQPFNTDFQNFLLMNAENLNLESVQKNHQNFMYSKSFDIFDKGDCSQIYSPYKTGISSEKHESYKIKDFWHPKESFKEELQESTIFTLKNSRTIHKTIDKNNKIIRYYESPREKNSEIINQAKYKLEEVPKTFADLNNNIFKKAKSQNLENNYSLKVFNDDSDSDTLNNIYCQELDLSNRSDCNRRLQQENNRNPKDSKKYKSTEKFNEKIHSVLKNEIGPEKYLSKFCKRELTGTSSWNSDSVHKIQTKISTDFHSKPNNKLEVNIRNLKNSVKTIFGNYGQKLI